MHLCIYHISPYALGVHTSKLQVGNLELIFVVGTPGDTHVVQSISPLTLHACVLLVEGLCVRASHYSR